METRQECRNVGRTKGAVFEVEHFSERKKTECSVELVDSIRDSIDDSVLADLVDKFIVIGVPPRYLRHSRH